jgi:hypothetical protein
MSETIREFLLKGEKNKDFVMTDIPKHGLGGGTISELIYYYDIDKFYNKHIEEVWDEVNELGGLIEIIKDEKNQPTSPSHFNCLMVWLAVENVACRICNEREDDRERIAEKNRNIQRVDAQVKGVKW